MGNPSYDAHLGFHLCSRGSHRCGLAMHRNREPQSTKAGLPRKPPIPKGDTMILEIVEPIRNVQELRQALDKLVGSQSADGVYVECDSYDVKLQLVEQRLTDGSVVYNIRVGRAL